MSSLTVLAQDGAPIVCPSCHRVQSAAVRVLPGSRGGVVVPLRCRHSYCLAYIEVVIPASSAPRAAVHVKATG